MSNLRPKSGTSAMLAPKPSSMWAGAGSRRGASRGALGPASFPVSSSDEPSAKSKLLYNTVIITLQDLILCYGQLDRCPQTEEHDLPGPIEYHKYLTLISILTYK